MSNENCCGEVKSCCCSASACCSEELIKPYDKADKWVTGEIVTPKGNIPVVSTRLVPKDTIGAWKARWGNDDFNCLTVCPKMVQDATEIIEKLLFLSGVAE